MQLKDIGKALVGIAPTIAGMFGGPLAATGVAALSNAVFGHPNAKTDDMVKAIQQGLTPEQIVAIRQADDALKQKFLDAGIQLETLDANDRANARKMAETDKWTPRLIALAVIVGAFIGEGYVLTHAIPAGSDMLVGRVMGTLDAALLSVLYFYYGSSRGSDDKNEMLKKAMA